jgi:hypothetical protein
MTPGGKMENVTVREYGSIMALSWEHKGKRYHIWTNSPDRVLFCNPPESVKYKGPGYFQTRKLSQSAKANARMIAEARKIADREGLWEKAKQETQREKDREAEENKAAIALKAKRDKAEVMHAALEQIASLWPDPDCCGELVPKFVGPNDGRMRADALWYALNAAREALGKPTYPRPEHWDTH